MDPLTPVLSDDWDTDRPWTLDAYATPAGTPRSTPRWR